MGEDGVDGLCGGDEGENAHVGAAVGTARLIDGLRTAEPYLDRLVVREGHKSLLVRTADVDWIEAAEN